MTDAPWQYESTPDLVRSRPNRLLSFRRQPNFLINALRVLAAMGLRVLLKTYVRFQIIGRENLPAGGSYVLVANHSSHLDALCLLCAHPLSQLHRTFTAAARDYFYRGLGRITLLAVFINATPISRKTNLRKSLDACRALLAQPGNRLILFPEGTRSTNGKMGDFRRGIGALVAGSPVRVVPCAMRGAASAWPKGTRIPRPRKVRLIIGKPRDYSDLLPSRAAAEFIAADLKDAVENLLAVENPLWE